MSDTDQIHELLPRYCEGNVTDEEACLVREWMEQSPENRRIVKQIHCLYLAVDTINVLEKTDTKKALLQARKRIDQKKNLPWFKWIQQVAAILFIPLLATLFIQHLNRQTPPQEDIQLMEVKTNPGMTTTITLPDHSVVYLNSESSLSYPSRFEGNSREVTLKGEAFFMVEKDESRLFIVSTPNQSHIKVFGTHFNVDAYEDSPIISTTLVEGSVQFGFTLHGTKKIVNLSPGQKLLYDQGTSQVKLVKTSGESETAWKDGKIVFSQTPMPEALRMLEKRYNVRFVIHNNRIMNDSFTGTFTHQRLERILELFKLSSKINWRYIESTDMSQEKNEIEIY